MEKNYHPSLNRRERLEKIGFIRFEAPEMMGQGQFYLHIDQANEPIA